MNRIYIYLVLFFYFLTVISPLKINYLEFPSYRVMLDPGHGGISLPEKSRHGDRYDPISETYLQYFAEGAAYGKLSEHEIVYSIALKVKKILDNCSPDGDFAAFYKIVSGFTNSPIKRIYLLTDLSRGDSTDRKTIEKRIDPNAEFRLFDFPGITGDIEPGRISRINAYKPHLLVSLHITSQGSRYYRGINPVIVAPYDFLYKGLKYSRGELRSKKFFYRSKYHEWFGINMRRTAFEWFLNDTLLYFMGYRSDKEGKISNDNFKGYRYNMVSWTYQDPFGWEEIARLHPNFSRYSDSVTTFIHEGKYWEREKSKYEHYRRADGYERFGGDNYYASAEIIRYILYSLELNGLRSRHQKLGRPYLSVWHMPLYVNAITAFIEIGYFNRSYFRNLYIAHQDEIAKGIAVGIYSLFAGMNPADMKKKKYKYLPRGKRIDLEKYSLTNGKSYFELVVDD